MKRVSVVYADPAWQFGSRAGGSWKSGSAAQYRTLSLEQLERLPVPAVLAPSAVLFLWAVVAQLPEAMRVMHAWGFRWVTDFVWVKTYVGKRLGMGFWHRGGTERLLVGVKGDVKPFRYQGPGWFEAPVGRHSEKPAKAREVVEACIGGFGAPHKLELFGRAPAEGWTVLGNEIDGVDIRISLRELAERLELPAARSR